jgi:hypothetical protein
MAKTPYPPERKRVQIYGRVSPETYRRLLALGKANIGRAVDALVQRLDDVAEAKLEPLRKPRRRASARTRSA